MGPSHRRWPSRDSNSLICLKGSNSYPGFCPALPHEQGCRWCNRGHRSLCLHTEHSLLTWSRAGPSTGTRVAFKGSAENAGQAGGRPHRRRPLLTPTGTSLHRPGAQCWGHCHSAEEPQLQTGLPLMQVPLLSHCRGGSYFR